MKHKHKFYPTDATTWQCDCGEHGEFIKPDKLDFREYVSQYYCPNQQPKRKFICECGKTKWVKEK